MRLYRATNGYIGESDVRVLVIAQDDESAMKLAHKRFSESEYSGGDEGYTKNIILEIICDDTGKEWSTEASDG